MSTHPLVQRMERTAGNGETIADQKVRMWDG